MAGYSGTPLVKKLGLKADHCVVLLEAPPDFAATLQGLPERVALHSDLPRSGRLDIILFFATSQAHLRQRFRALAQRLAPAGGLWIAWLKKASGVATGLAGDGVRAVGLEAGLVDNKVCAVDDTWSGLRFVIRLVNR